MARTKAEVRAFLDSKVGTTCVDQSNHALNGQCVCLIKNLMDFLGVPNPYGARGNAITAGDAYIAQGIGTSGKGWLTICVNRSMGYIGGVYYGHIWVDLAGEANYESNGARALVTTKNTRPITQAQQFVNFDKWITGGEGLMIIQNSENWYQRCNGTHQWIRGRELARSTFAAYVGRDFLHFVEDCEDDPEAVRTLNALKVGQLAVKDNWQQQIYDLQAQLKGRPSAEQLAAAQKQAAELSAQMESANQRAIAAENKVKNLEAVQAEAEKTGNAFVLWLGGILSKLTGGK